MTRELTCIGCPMGCSLVAEVENGKAVSVSGNSCQMGKKYAEQEVSAPSRMVTTTVMSAQGVPVPVRTAAAIPKDMIFDIMREIKAVSPDLPAGIGDIVIEDVCGTGIPVIVTGNISGK